MAAACGTSDGDTATGEDDATTSSSAPATETGDEPEPEQEPEPESESKAEPEPDPEPDPVVVPSPAAAMPTLGEPIELPFLAMASHADHLFVAAPHELLRYDPASGTIDSVAFPQGDEQWNSGFGLVAAGDHLLVNAWAADSYTGLDLGLSFDAATLERNARLQYPGVQGSPSFWPLPGFGGSNRVTTWHVIPPFHQVLDPATLEVIAPLEFALVDDLVADVDGNWWVLRADGSGAVVTDDGTELASFDIGRPLELLGAEAMHLSDTEVWFVDLTVPAIMRFDRATYELIETVNLLSQFDDDVRLADVSTGGEYAIAQIGSTEGGAYLLLRFDLTTGEIRSRHHVAPTDLEYWDWSSFDTPKVEVVGGRVFVRDAYDRIREVDVAALDTPSDVALVADPGTLVTFEGEEALIAEAADALGLGPEWRGRGFESGERAWVAFSLEQPDTFAFAERIDGVWTRRGGAWFLAG